MTNDFGPTATWENLRRRAILLKQLRRFFENCGFLEVQTPLLSHDVVVDRFLEPLAVTVFDDPQQPHVGCTMWLQTSPEFGMKRLLAAGTAEHSPAIYQVAQAFRATERGALHNLEFTLVEWYRIGDGMEEGMELLSQLCQTLLQTQPARRLRYRDAFLQWAGVDPFTCSLEEFARVELSSGEPYDGDPGKMDRDQWLNLILAERVEPFLGVEQPVILYEFPAGGAALAQVRLGPPEVAERFELYVQGVELANGYHELLDPQILRRRAAQANQQRAAEGRRRLPEDSRLLAAMEHGLPNCAGAALGFDRLAMLAAGAQRIEEVMTFPEHFA